MVEFLIGMQVLKYSSLFCKSQVAKTTVKMSEKVEMKSIKFDRAKEGVNPTKLFSFCFFKLGHFKVNALFSSVTNAQS